MIFTRPVRKFVSNLPMWYSRKIQATHVNFMERFAQVIEWFYVKQHWRFNHCESLVSKINHIVL